MPDKTPSDKCVLRDGGEWCTVPLCGDECPAARPSPSPTPTVDDLAWTTPTPTCSTPDNTR